MTSRAVGVLAGLGALAVLVRSADRRPAIATAPGDAGVRGLLGPLALGLGGAALAQLGAQRGTIAARGLQGLGQGLFGEAVRDSALAGESRAGASSMWSALFGRATGRYRGSAGHAIARAAVGAAAPPLARVAYRLLASRFRGHPWQERQPRG